MKKTKSKKQWFSSTMLVLVTAFVIFAIYGIYAYGWKKVLDESILYLIGATFTAIIISILAYVHKANKIKLW